MASNLEALGGILDLELAWRRVLTDVDARAFVPDTVEFLAVKRSPEAWLRRLRSSFDDGNYAPSPMTFAYVPKSRGLARPGSILTLRDRVAYTALVGACYPQIHHAVAASGTRWDYSYPFPANASAVEWIVGRFTAWREFRTDSIGYIERGADHVVMGDIVGYYEHISIPRLVSDLNTLSCNADVVRMIGICLNRWSVIDGRGIPQGCHASDVLGKLYLSNIDRSLADRGYRHKRYVDDVRIFSTSRAEAERAMLFLQELLRRRGLSVQSKKSRVLERGEAIAEIEGVMPILQPIHRAYIGDALSTLGVDISGITLKEIDAYITSQHDDVPIAVIRSAVDQYIAPDIDVFDSTLFRFLFNRLKNVQDQHGVPLCTSIATARPELFEDVLRYLGSVNAAEGIQAEMLGIVEASPFPHHAYWFLGWLDDHVSSLHASVSAYVRRLSFDTSSPMYVRNRARRTLGCFGSPADLERLADAYDQAAGSEDRAAILHSISRLERSRRNALYGRARTDGDLEAIVVEWLRN